MICATQERNLRNVFEAKIDDLNKQVQSLQMICVTQDRKLRRPAREGMKNQTGTENEKEKRKRQQVKDIDKAGDKPLFTYSNISPPEHVPLQYRQDLSRPNVDPGHSPYDPVHMYDHWGGPPLPNGPSSYEPGGTYEAFYGYDPYRSPFQAPYEPAPYPQPPNNDRQLRPVPGYPEQYLSAQYRPPPSFS